MNCCSKKCISIITLIIAVIIFIQTNFLTLMILNLKSNIVQANSSVIKDNSKDKTYEEINEEWRLIVPKLNISAQIKEGTSGEVINNYIGHFGETPKDNGNIGLIAASAGYKENYFEKLADLVEGDVIIYIKGELKREYKVITNIIIKETDWSYLSATEDNKITLITGILEEPENRRCVQAIEVNI